MSDGLLFVTIALAVFRVWRLVGRDDITAWFRTFLPNWVLKPLTCPWCAGSQLSIAAAFGVDRWVTKLEPGWPLWAVAVAAVVGFLGEIDARLDG